jgi:acetoacetate decarboxylase
VVDVASVQSTVRKEHVDGTLVLRDSPWDPYTTLLPMHELLSADLVWTRTVSREITLAGPLDPLAFWPYADTIGGSRWPGFRGGPRFED